LETKGFDDARLDLEIDVTLLKNDDLLHLFTDIKQHIPFFKVLLS